MILLSDFMTKFAYFVGDKENAVLYSQQNNAMKANLHNLLFNEETGLYTDWADK
jgi:neutral trehalase